MRKIRFSFGILCLVLTISIVMYNLLFPKDNGSSSDQSKKVAYSYSIFCVGCYIILKLHTHFQIYRDIKYKDDGRDSVSLWDFIAIHVTFPLFNAWFTYQVIFVLFLLMTNICPWDYRHDKPHSDSFGICAVLGGENTDTGEVL